MNDYDLVALTLIPRPSGSYNSIKCVEEVATPSNVIYFSFLTPLVWQLLYKTVYHMTSPLGVK